MRQTTTVALTILLYAITIYNSFMGSENIIYSDEKENSAVSEIFEKTGLESKPISDYLYYHESEENGGVIIKAVSDSNLEEDLAQMEKGETVLGAEAHARIIREAYKDTLKLLGDYIPHDKVERLFPGIDLADLDAYDFTAAKIKALVLSNEDYEFFESNFFQNSENRNSGGITTPTVAKSLDSELSNRVQVNLSQKNLIVLKELGRYVSHLSKKIESGSAKDLTEADRDQISLNLRRVVIHEFLHSLDVSMDLPYEFTEAITEWYTREVLNGVSEERVVLDKNSYGGMYENMVEGMSILVNAMLDSGMPSETVDKAFLASDAESRQKIVDFLNDRYGKEEADKIMKWRFSSSEKFLVTVAWLERKHARGVDNRN